MTAAQKDLSAIGSTLESGAGKLTKDVAKLLHDARRDVTKMSKLVRRDLDHLQKDLGVTSETKPSRKRPARLQAKASKAPPRTRRAGA